MCVCVRVYVRVCVRVRVRVRVCRGGTWYGRVDIPEVRASGKFLQD